MPDLLDQKLKHFFTRMNRDASATLELGDYMISADELNTALGHETGSAKHEELRDRYRRFWEQIVLPMDADNDGHVTFEEYMTGYTAMVRDNADGYQLIKPIADTLIAIADPEATGKITGDRLVTILAAGFNVPEPDSRNVFADLDTQQAGYLTPDQIHEAAQEFFLGTDSTAPANALFGRF